MKEYAAMSFGEVMLRLSPMGKERISQSESFVKNVGGSELNVVSAMSRLGLRTGLITRLPASPVGQYVRNQIRSYGVSDDYVFNDPDDDSRLGIYYYESGVFPRKSQVVYDRKHSSFHSFRYGDVPGDVFGKSGLFHISSISMALSKEAGETSVYLMEQFRKAGAKISFDVNYRANLWSEEEARVAIEAVLPLVDVLFISEETSRRMFGRTGELGDIQKGFARQYGIGVVASTKREVISPNLHNFTSLVYSAHEDRFFEEEPYRRIEVIDRIGSGDAFVAGALYGLIQDGDPEKAMEYGNAMAALKNTVPGDLLSTDIGELRRIVEEHKGTGSFEEMKR